MTGQKLAGILAAAVVLALAACGPAMVTRELRVAEHVRPAAATSDVSVTRSSEGGNPFVYQLLSFDGRVCDVSLEVYVGVRDGQRWLCTWRFRSRYGGMR